MKFKLDGIKRAQADIARLKREKQDAVRKQVAKTAFAIETRAKRTVRVDTGRLRASITVQFTDGGYNASVGSNAEYAGSQEFGLPGRRYSYTPYLMPAFFAERQGFLDSVKQIFSK